MEKKGKNKFKWIEKKISQMFEVSVAILIKIMGECINTELINQRHERIKNISKTARGIFKAKSFLLCHTSIERRALSYLHALVSKESLVKDVYLYKHHSVFIH